jgi:hypothetical protein
MNLYMSDYIFPPPPPESVVRRLVRLLSRHTIVSINFLASICTIASPPHTPPTRHDLGQLDSAPAKAIFHNLSGWTLHDEVMGDGIPFNRLIPVVRGQPASFYQIIITMNVL